jgi:hypothetical protein
MPLADRLSGASEPWRPADNEDHPNPLIGTVVEIDEGDGDYGPYPILYIKDDDGNEWRWHVFGGVAQGRMIKLRPEVGDTIGARFLGTVPSKTKGYKPYANWKIALEKASGKAAGGPDWDAMKATPEDDVAPDDDF